MAGWIRAAAGWPALGYWALAAGICVVYGAWPGALWGKPHVLGNYGLGLIPVPASTPDSVSVHGERPWFAEFHWHGLQLLTGNAFVLGGLVLLIILVCAAVQLTRTRRAGPRLPPLAQARRPRPGRRVTPEAATAEPAGHSYRVAGPRRGRPRTGTRRRKTRMTWGGPRQSTQHDL